MDKYESISDFLINISSNLFLEINECGEILFTNTKAKLIFFSDDKAPKTLDTVFDKNNQKLFMTHIQNVLYQNKTDTFQFEYNRRYYSAFAYPYKKNVIISIEDITDRRLLAYRLYQTKQRLDFAEKTAQLGYWELDLEKRNFYWSSEMYSIFGLNMHQISSKKNLIREQIYPDDLPIYKQKLSQIVKDGHPVEGQVRIRRADNNAMVYCLFKAGIINYRGKKQIAGIFQNITPLIQIQNQLEAARKQADKLNMDKSYFLAQASHDLRQPLQAVNLFLSVLETENDPDEQSIIINKIKESCDNLNNLLNNLLDISKLDSGGMTFERETFNLYELLQRLKNEYELTAKEKGIRLKLIGKDIILDSDAVLIERIIRNFLSNAIKYTKNKIIISCYKYNKKIVIRVLDNGIGIAQNEINEIFEDFYQSRQIKNNRKNGAGLGLSIVKKIAGLLNGKISVKSNEGKYTVFSLSLHS